jgi:flagellar hook protein FlgE
MGFQQGVSGLTVAGRNLEVIGNNVANASTIGAKKARAEFADLYARASGGGGGGASGIGLGVSLAAVSQQFSQGSITTSDNPLDIAISGGGFFQLKDLNNATQYSRAGQFKIDSVGNIVNNQGSKLLGFQAVNGVVQSGQVAQPLVLGTKGIEPSATTRVTLEANFDATKASVVDPTDNTMPIGIDVNNQSTYTNATSATFYDSKGQEVPVTFLFQKTLPTPADLTAVPPVAQTDNWVITAAVQGPDNTMQPVQVSLTDTSQWNIRVSFDANGQNPVFSPLSATNYPVPFTVPSTTTDSGAFTLPFEVGTNASNPIDFSGLTQYASTFGVTGLSSNGAAPGQLSQLQVQADGVLMATYSNGKSQPIGQLELATFRNEQGLQPLGGNTWGQTNESGQPIKGPPGTGNLGVVQGGAVEESNVDLTAELVQMMVAQRIYQANAQTIKTQDSVLQTMVNLR